MRTRCPNTITSLLFNIALAAALLPLAPHRGAAQDLGREFQTAHRDFFHLLLFDQDDFRFQYRYDPQRDEDGGPGELELNAVSLSGELPFPISIDSFLRAGLEYDARLYDFGEVPGSIIQSTSETLHKIELHLGYGTFFNDDFLFFGRAEFGGYSNFSGGVDTDDFQVQGRGLFIYRLNPGAQLLAGAGASQDFDDYDVYPIAGLRLLSSDGTIHISVTAPLSARLAYRPSASLEYYGGIWISGDRYYVEIDDQKFDIQLQDRKVGGGIIYWFGEHFNVSAEAGVLLQSQFQFKLENAGQFHEDVDPGGYIGAGFGFAL